MQPVVAMTMVANAEIVLIRRFIADKAIGYR